MLEQNKEKIKQFIMRFVRGHELMDDEEIFAKGYVNSMFAMQLVMFIEKEFHIRIGSEDMELVNFSSINKITLYVQKKQQVTN